MPYLRIKKLAGKPYHAGEIITNGKPIIALVDGNNFCIRAYYSKKKNDHSSASNFVDRAFGMLIRLLDSLHATSVVFFFDDGHPWRTRIHEECKYWMGKNSNKGYKGHRTLHRLQEYEEIKKGMAHFSSVLEESLGVPTVKVKGLEADDLIYMCAKHLFGVNKLVVSADEDLAYCCVHPNTFFYSPNKDYILSKGLFQRYNGYLLEYYPYLKAIVGDSSDNIEGVYRCSEVRVNSWYTHTGVIPWNFPEFCNKYSRMLTGKDVFGSKVCWRTSLKIIHLEEMQKHLVKKGKRDSLVWFLYGRIAGDIEVSREKIKDFCREYEIGADKWSRLEGFVRSIEKNGRGLRNMRRIWYGLND